MRWMKSVVIVERVLTKEYWILNVESVFVEFFERADFVEVWKCLCEGG